MEGLRVPDAGKIATARQRGVCSFGSRGLVCIDKGGVRPSTEARACENERCCAEE